ncbi:MAG: hypothetical protein OQL28_15915 [Sedimenticola sp.]|nr:hypothetical protein [Sedimenticola sp.]
MIELIYFAGFILIILVGDLVPAWCFTILFVIDLFTEKFLTKNPLIWLERVGLLVWLLWDLQSPLELAEELEVLALIITMAWAYGRIGQKNNL